MPRNEFDGSLPLAIELKGRGWWFDGPNGGWMHNDVRNDDGMLLPCGTLQEVSDYLGIEAEEYLTREGANKSRSLT
jgi:hypothetical protein